MHSESSWARSAKLTEFQRIKDSVRRLEQSSRAQLALEQESQNVFDFLKGESVRVKKSIGALSTVVDDELAAVRAEVSSLQEEVQRGVALSKNATDSTVNLIGESRKRDTEWMQLSFNQIKDAVAKLDADLKEARAQIFELSSAYASAVASADSNHGSLSRQVGAISERLATTEARASQTAGELAADVDVMATLREEHRELLAWSKTAEPRIAALKGFDSVQQLTESVHAHTSALQQRQDGAAQQLAMASEELSRHRDAIVLMVETVDTLSRDSKAAHEALAARVGEHIEAAEQHSAEHDRALASLAAEVAESREVARRIEGRVQEQAQAANLGRLSTSHQADGLQNVEREVHEVKQEAAQHAALIRTLKASSKESVEALTTFKTSVRRALEDVDNRHDKLCHATSIFADALKVANPLTELDLPRASP